MMGDVFEVKNWSEVLGCKGSNFLKINVLKFMIGYCLSVVGVIEFVVVIL